MELDEMKQAWQAVDRRLAKQQALDLELYRDRRMDRLRQRLRPLAWWTMVQIPLGIALMLWGIRFWSTHIGDARSVACGMVMQLFGLLSVMFPGRTLAMVLRIDYAAPVLEIQRRLADLRAWRVKVEAPVSAVIGSLIWIPALLMLAQSQVDGLGWNLWDHARPGLVRWLVLSVLVSLGAVALAYGVLRWLGLHRWLANHLAGASVRRAEAELDAVLRFERESG